MVNEKLCNEITPNTTLYAKRVHFIGVLGVSMRGLALITREYTENVTGSDSTYSDVAERLIARGVDVYIGHDVSRVLESDIIVYTAAIPESDEELSCARREGKVCMTRAEYLGLLMSMARTSIAVAGTHGKSTTTALLGHIMSSAHMSVTTHVGAETVETIDNASIDEYFVTEACEYRRSFLSLSPHIGVVLNVDYDHPDEYRDIDDVRRAFDAFMDRCGIVVAHENVGRRDAITYGTGEDVDYRIANIESVGGRYHFDVVHEGKSVALTCPLMGKHNILNVTAAYVVAHLVGMDDEDIMHGIDTFHGIRRRFERVGAMESGASVVHDYAHHPEEIRRVIATAMEITHGRLVVVFEPHTYSRTKSLIHAFSTAFYWADSLILLPTYPAREREEDGYTTLELISHMRDVGEYPLYFDSYNRACQYLRRSTTRGDTILVLGAGSVYHLADMLVE